MHDPARGGRRRGERAADPAQSEDQRGLGLRRVDGERAGAAPQADPYDGLRGRVGEHLVDHPVPVPQREAVREVAQRVGGAGHGRPVADLHRPRGLGGELQPDADGQGGALAGVPGQPHGVGRIGADRPPPVQPGDPAQEGQRVLPGLRLVRVALQPGRPRRFRRPGRQSRSFQPRWSSWSRWSCWPRWYHWSPPIVGYGNFRPTPPPTTSACPGPAGRSPWCAAVLRCPAGRRPAGSTPPPVPPRSPVPRSGPVPPPRRGPMPSGRPRRSRTCSGRVQGGTLRQI